MRLAHFSDIHVTVPPLGQPWGSLRGKRVAGSCNYYLGGRYRAFRDVEARIAALLSDVEAQSPDHALCTGDITAMSLPEEFARCAALFGPRQQHPERWTVLPGNHDRYTPEAVETRAFEQHFAALSGATFPFAKALGGGVTLVALDVARPTGLLDSSGRCGPEQLAAARALLSDASRREEFLVLALHYSFLRADGRPETHSHGMEDQAALVELLADPAVHVDLVLHGHEHHAFRQTCHGRPVLCAGSATDLRAHCGYNVYDIDVPAKRFLVQRRVWQADAGRYAPAP